MIRKILAYMGTYKKQAMLTPIVIVGEVVLDVLIPYLMAQIVNVGITNRDLPFIAKMGIAMILMAGVSLFLGVIASRFSATAGAGLSKNIRRALFSRVQDFSFANIDKFSTASLVTRLTTDVSSLQNMFVMMLRMAVRAPIMLLCAVFMAISINARLAVIFLLVTPILVGAMVIMMLAAHPRFLKMLKAVDQMNGVVQENLTAIRVVKAFVREDFETEKFSAVADHVRHTAFRAQKVMVWIMPIMQLVMFACIIAIMWFGGMQIIGGTMLTGDLMSFITYSSQILMSLMMLGMIFMMFVMSRASITRILEVLDEQPTIVSAPQAQTDVKDGSIRFEDVVFRYHEGSEEATLSHINLHILPGETVGIIGATGSAKTTLVQLIPRLYDVQAGAVYVGGTDVREYDLSALRSSVAMVLQNNVLFSGTIYDNLRWGNKEATDEEIASACRIAQAHAFIMSFPEGYDTVLGQGGVNVSGGQKQRLCIARALLKNPKIMILDDSTSAVDTTTDSKIREHLRRELNGMTTIIIAQRIASIMDADRIVVLDEGKVNAVGTHSELLKSNVIYHDVYTSQLKGVEQNG